MATSLPAWGWRVTTTMMWLRRRSLVIWDISVVMWHTPNVMATKMLLYFIVLVCFRVYCCHRGSGKWLSCQLQAALFIDLCRQLGPLGEGGSVLSSVLAIHRSWEAVRIGLQDEGPPPGRCSHGSSGRQRKPRTRARLCEWCYCMCPPRLSMLEGDVTELTYHTVRVCSFWLQLIYPL